MDIPSLGPGASVQEIQEELMFYHALFNSLSEPSLGNEVLQRQYQEVIGRLETQLDEKLAIDDGADGGGWEGDDEGDNSEMPAIVPSVEEDGTFGQPFAVSSPLEPSFPAQESSTTNLNSSYFPSASSSFTLPSRSQVQQLPHHHPSQTPSATFDLPSFGFEQYAAYHSGTMDPGGPSRSAPVDSTRKRPRAFSLSNRESDSNKSRRTTPTTVGTQYGRSGLNTSSTHTGAPNSKPSGGDRGWVDYATQRLQNRFGGSHSSPSSSSFASGSNRPNSNHKNNNNLSNGNRSTINHGGTTASSPNNGVSSIFKDLMAESAERDRRDVIFLSESSSDSVEFLGARPVANILSGRAGVRVSTTPTGKMAMPFTPAAKLHRSQSGIPVPDPYPQPVPRSDMYRAPKVEETKAEISKLLDNIKPNDETTSEPRDQTPASLAVTLKEHQKIGLAWLRKMEEGSSKGSILADDMGLGKTITALALIMARPSENPLCKTTLIIAPLALMKQWEREIREKVKENHRLKVYIFHGSTKRPDFATLRQYDIILTTYGTLAADFKRKLAWLKRLEGNPSATPTSKDSTSLVGDNCRWYRVILDEAQCIKNRRTKSARSCFELRSVHRLCMTGTPMMNSTEELFSLIHFLRIRPYNDWKIFQANFVIPITKVVSAVSTAMRKLHALLKVLLLRRTKDSLIDGKPIINLPDKLIDVDNAEFSKDEHELYKALESKSKLQFNRYLKAGSVSRNYSSILILLLRLRQACCHPHLIKDLNDDDPLDEIRINAARMLPPDVYHRVDQIEAFECPICLDAAENPTIFVPCGHYSCSECWATLTDTSQGYIDGGEIDKIKCPGCRTELDPRVSTDLKAFKKAYLPPLELIREKKKRCAGPLEAEDSSEEDDEDNNNDSINDADEEEEEEDSSTGDDEDDEDSKSLQNFIVNDEDDEDDGEDDKMPVGNAKKRSATKAKMGSARKQKQNQKMAAPAKPKLTLAELRRESLRSKSAKKKYIRRLERTWEPSGKIQKAMGLLREIGERTPDDKTLVFSQFTSLLDLLEVPIAREGWHCERYEGSMTMSQRQAAVNNFMDDPNCKIMLISLKAGNAGLNLTRANHVVIMDPFWNPYIEQQAVDRTYRLGQEKDVHVHRVLVPDTVENRIVDLQDRKRNIIEAALDQNAASQVGRLGVTELKYLFGMSTAPHTEAD